MSDIGWLVGPLLISAVLNTFLFGVTSYQFAIYFYAKFDDSLWMRGLVGSLAAIDAFHSCLILYTVWFYCIENYSHPENLGYPLWAYMLTPILEVIPALLTQAFLTMRVFKLTRNIYLCGLIMSFALTSGSFAMAAGAKAFTISSLSQIADMKYICIPWLVFQAATDVLISASLAIPLARSHTGIQRTAWALRKLLRRALQTGIPASLFATASLATYVAMGTKASNLYAFFSLSLGRIYTLTLMDTLIVRKKLREGMLNKSDTTRVINNLRGQLHAQGATTTTEGTVGEIPVFRVGKPAETKADEHDHHLAPTSEESGKDDMFVTSSKKAAEAV